MKFDIITIFPNAFDSYFNESIVKRAQNKKLIKINIHNLRNYTTDKHKTVDDKPYGGGPGMVLKIEPIYKAIQSISTKSRQKSGRSTKRSDRTMRIILFSAKGKKFTQRDAHRLAKYKHLVMICGHYEGVDERVAKHIADEEISIGDYVLTGGEIPAMVVTDAVARLIPGVLGKKESLEEIKGSYPVYTRPDDFLSRGKAGNKWKVPKVLLSGNHEKIKEWRKKYLRTLKK